MRDDTDRIIADVAWHSGVQASLLNRDVLRQADELHLFSYELSPKMEAADQKWSGRCWAFAGLALLRRELAEKYALPKDFELSATYIMFYDKYEKAAAFLYYVEKRLEEGYSIDTDDRRMHRLLSDPIPDGACWCTFDRLVKKYGIVPAVTMPESASSKYTKHLNVLLRTLLLQSVLVPKFNRKEILERVLRLLCTCLGAPLKPHDCFTWTYRDRDDNVKTLQVTPFELYQKTERCDDVVLMNLPHEEYDKSYNVEYMDTVCADHLPLSRLYNVKAEVLKQAALDTLRDNHAVWFSCEFDACQFRDQGLLHHDLIHLERGIGMRLAPKKDRFRVRAVDVNHAMLLTGFHGAENACFPVRWQVENSFGDEHRDGYLSMTDQWFADHVLEIVVPRAWVAKHHSAILDTDPIMLPPWRFG